MKKIKVEIWSDVMCPFCYIGKRRFEAALADFEHSDNVEVIWKSFMLQPDLITDPEKNMLQHLSEQKGWSMEQTRQITAQVVNMAAEVGLIYNFEKALVANSFDAHRLSHFAKSKGMGNAFEEVLFKAYFIDGKNTAERATLAKLAVEVGLNENEAFAVLDGDEFSADVQRDIYESHQVGLRGVPHFILADNYAISGAQSNSVFLQALRKTWQETLA